ncbi:MAG: MobQ family relaxase [Cyanobacteria bacterium J06621_3]
MAIYSFRMQVIGRSAGRSATAAAAYRSGEEIKDERTGQSHDYTGKSDIYDNEILKPENAPERYADRQTLWNEVEQREKRKDSQLCNEVMVALPAELTHEQKQQLTREYVQGEFVEQGMIADIGYHDFDSHNPHAHIMLTMRSVNEEGFGKKKREWNRRDAVKDYRAHWADYANRALERAGHDVRIDHRSLKEQGIEREPQIHLGAQVMEMEAKGIQTRVGDESRRISKVNRDIARRQKARDKVQADIKDEQRDEQLRSQPQPTPEQQSSTEQTQTQKPQEEAQKKAQQQDKQIEQQRQRSQAQQRQQKRIRKKQQDRGYGY